MPLRDRIFLPKAKLTAHRQSALLLSLDVHP